MTNIPPKPDPSADWPQEIKQAYEQLKIPSLYDAVLANEKLSLEIRRQDRDLKSILEGIQGLSTQFNSLIKIVEEEWEEYEEEDLLQPPSQQLFDLSQAEVSQIERELYQESSQQFSHSVQFALADTYDGARELCSFIKQMMHQLQMLLPKKEEMISPIPSWHPLAEEIVGAIEGKIDSFRYQILSYLEKVQIEIIDPQLGDTYNPAFHHALENISGGLSGTIARVFKVGYKQQDRVLRLAQVTIYH